MNGEEEGCLTELWASSSGSYRLPRELANRVLLRLVVDEEEVRPIRLAEAEAEDDGTLDDFKGDAEPWPVTVGFVLLRGCDGDLVCSFMSSSLIAPVVADLGCRRPFKARSLSP